MHKLCFKRSICDKRGKIKYV